MSRVRALGRASAALVMVGSAFAAAGCAAEQTVQEPAADLSAQWFRYHLTYTLAAEVNARLAMVGEYIGGADPAQFAGEESWQTMEAQASEACAIAAEQGWSSARLFLEEGLQSGVTSGDSADSSIFANALVNAATAPGSFCPELQPGGF